MLLNSCHLFVVQLLSHVQLFVTPWTAACQASLCFTISQSLLKLMSIESVIPPNHLILCQPLLLLLWLFPSIRVFANELALCIRWPKYCSFSFIISPSNEYSGLASFRIDQFDLLAVQGTLKSRLQHHSSKASILRCSGGTLLFSQPHYQAFTESVPPSEGATTQLVDLCPHKGSLAFLSSPRRLRRMLRSMFSEPHLSNLFLWTMISKLDISLRKSCKWK